MKCHDHEVVSLESDAPSMVCPSGMENVRTVNNPDYGSMNENECSEFCTPPVFLNMMTNVELGTCSEIGFMNNPNNMKVKPAGSSMEIEMLVTNNLEQSSCHCHSYEEIKCPEIEAPDDTLYDEHIEEIEQYCLTVLNG